MPVAATLDKLVAIGDRLPAAARILNQLDRLLDRPDSSLEDICALIRQDMALTGRTIQVSNSSYYGSALAHASLEEAVGYVGYDEVYRLVGITVGAQMAQTDLKYFACPAGRLWENTMSHALAMEALAQYTRLSPRVAYTAGLMRSIGKAALDVFATENVPPHKAYRPWEQASLEEWERLTFACDSAEAGAVLLKEWKFPEAICEAVGGQRHPESVGAHLLYLAGWVTHEIGCDLPGEDALWPDLKDLLIADSGVTESDLRLVLDETKTGLARLQDSLSP